MKKKPKGSRIPLSNKQINKFITFFLFLSVIGMIYPILIPLINYHYIEKGSIIIITLFLFCMGVISAVIFQETKYKTFTMYSFFLTYTSLLLFIFYGIIALSPTSDIIKIIIIEIIALILLVLFIYLKRKKNA